MKFIFWQNIISPHQISFFNELAKLRSGHSIGLVVENVLTEDRICLGWEEPQLEGIELFINPNKDAIWALFKDYNSFHIFSGIRAYPLIRMGLKVANTNKSKFAIISEIPDLRSIKGFIRKLMSYYIERPISKKAQAVFAIGKEAEDWYKKNGFAANFIFPFIYTTHALNNVEIRVNNYNLFRIVFVGNLIPRKGLALFISALGKLFKYNWQFDIIGDGPQKSKLLSIVSKRNFKEKIRFLGVMKNEQIKQSLSNYDLLVLPSYHDGWGAVINESLMSGIPVLCSDKCGAKDLIINSKRGWVFKSGSKKSLYNLLEKILIEGPLTPQDRHSIIEWSDKITGESIAKYFIDTIEYTQGFRTLPPAPPWLE